MFWQRRPQRFLQSCQRTSIGQCHGIADRTRSGSKQKHLSIDTYTKKQTIQPPSLSHESGKHDKYAQTPFHWQQKKKSFENSHRARIVLPQRLIRHGSHGACITLNLLREMSKLIHHRLNPANIEISIVESSENCKQHSRIQCTNLVLSSCCCTASNAKLHHKQT